MYIDLKKLKRYCVGQQMAYGASTPVEVEMEQGDWVKYSDLAAADIKIVDSETTWLFIVDTNEYAGNFERDMCAYMTGRIGECEVGGDYASIFRKETKHLKSDFFENVFKVSDDHGCFRPVEAVPNPGWVNNGMGKQVRIEDAGNFDHKCPAYNSVGIWFREKPTAEQIKVMKERAILFSKHPLGSYLEGRMNIESFRILKKETRTVEEIIEENV